jgi:large subunit ribosomal protein L4
MIDVPVYNTAGDQVDTLQVDEAQFGGNVRPALLKQALVMYHANQRQGTVMTKGRSDIKATGKKMYKQKGTGNARAGTKTAPQRRGGGHATQKLPKDWSQDMPKKQRRLAAKNALLAKFQDGTVKVVDDFVLPEVKTKHVAATFKNLGLDKTVLFALPNDSQHKQKNDDLFRAGRNLAGARFTSVSQLNAWDVLRNRVLLLTRDGFQQLVSAA